MMIAHLARAAGALAMATALIVIAPGCARDGGAEPPLPFRLAASGLNPTSAVDPAHGATYAAWITTGPDGGSDVLFTRVGGQQTPVRVNDIAGEAAPHDQAPAQVAVGPEGNIYVVWQTAIPIEGRRFPASNLRMARSIDGGQSFEAAIHVNDDAGGTPSSHSFHDVVVAPDGTVLVSWIDGRERDAARAARAATTAPATNGHGMNGHGGDDHDLPGSEVRIARSVDGGRSFGAGRVVGRGVCPCCRTSVAVGRDGSVFVAWRREAEGDVRDVVIARASLPSLDFAAAVPVHEDGWIFPACPHAGPSLAVDDDGVVHATWYTGREGRQGLWYARSLDGAGTFSTPQAIVGGEWVPPSQARLAVSGERVLIAWEDRREENPRISVATIMDGRVSRPLLLADGALPSLTADEGGWSLVWSHAGGVNSAQGGS